MKLKFLNLLTVALTSSLVIVFTHHADAASATWNGTTDGIWSTVTNWSATPVPGAGDIATFNNAGNGNTTITVGTITLGRVTFDTASAAAYTLNGGDITFANGTTTGTSMTSTVTKNEIINANLILGTTAVASNTTFSNASTTGLLTLGGNITGGTGGTAAAKTLTVAGAGNTTISGGVISDGGATALNLTKSGTGILNLSGANTYTGATNVNEGKLVVTNSLGASAITVQNAGTILATDAAASFGSSLTIKNGAILAVGDVGSVGTATVTGGVTFESGSIFSWDLNAGTSDPVPSANQGTYDKVIGSASGTAGIFEVVLGTNSYSDPFWSTNKTWTDIFSAGTESFSQFAGNFVSSSGYVAGFGSFTYTGGTLSWNAIPEPTGALAGLLLGAGLLRRRREPVVANSGQS